MRWKFKSKHKKNIVYCKSTAYNPNIQNIHRPFAIESLRTHMRNTSFLQNDIL